MALLVSKHLPSIRHDLKLRLGSYKCSQLLQIASECGIPLGLHRTKSAVVDILDVALHEANELRGSFLINSIDLGLKNFAWAQIGVKDGSAILLNWEKLEIDLPESMNPRSFARQMRKLTEYILENHAESERNLFLIERQRHRTFGSPAIPEVIFTLGRIEYQLHCFLLDYDVRSVDPRQVSACFSMDTGKAKKQHAIQLVLEALKKPAEIQVSPEFQEYFHNQKKKDDLADCLLQGMAFLKWQRNRNEVVNELIAKCSNSMNNAQR